MPYIPMDITYIPNTTMKKFINSLGNHTQYVITPNAGYVLHDRAGGWESTDEITGELVFNRAYYYGSCSCGASYDFTPTQITLENGSTVTAYGEREFFAILESEAPIGQIFNLPNNHEKA